MWTDWPTRAATAASCGGGSSSAAASRPKTLPPDPAVIWVEKILAPGEHLPTDWLTDGTTGYDFMNDVAALLHDPAGEAPLTALWSGLTGRPAAFEEEARAARRQILRESLFSELYATAAALHRIARRDLRTRDYTLTAVRRALEELLVHFPVYRILRGHRRHLGDGRGRARDRDARCASQRAGCRPPPARAHRRLAIRGGAAGGRSRPATARAATCDGAFPATLVPNGGQVG